MRKTVKTQIIKWNEDGISVDEMALIIPQYSKPEIKAVIKEHEKELAWKRITNGSQH